MDKIKAVKICKMFTGAIEKQEKRTREIRKEIFPEGEPKMLGNAGIEVLWMNHYDYVLQSLKYVYPFSYLDENTLFKRANMEWLWLLNQKGQPLRDAVNAEEHVRALDRAFERFDTSIQFDDDGYRNILFTTFRPHYQALCEIYPDQYKMDDYPL